MSSSVLSRMHRKAAARLIPMEAMIVLTERCHLRCQQCYLVEHPRPEMTTDKICDVLDQLAAMGAFYVVLTGGEPLLRPDIYEIIRHADNAGIMATIFTTATSCNEERVQKLVAAGLSRASISVYAAEAALHDEVTQIPGSLDKTMAGVRQLLRADIGVELKFLQMSTNVGQLEAVRALAEEVGADFSVDYGITACHDGRRDPMQLQTQEELLFQIHLQLAANDPHGLGKITPMPERQGQHMCSAGRTRLSVGTDGDVYTCLRLTVPVGNVHEQSLEEIWHDHRTQEIRKLTKFSDPVCRVCPDRAFCYFCPGQALLEAGDLTSPNATTCMLARVRRRTYEAVQADQVDALRQPLPASTALPSGGCQQCTSGLQDKLEALLQHPPLFPSETEEGRRDGDETEHKAPKPASLRPLTSREMG